MVVLFLNIDETDISNLRPTGPFSIPYGVPQPDLGVQPLLWKRLRRPPQYMQIAPIPLFG